MLIAKSLRLAEAAAAAKLAAQNAVQIVEHLKAAQKASDMATKSMLSPSDHLRALPEVPTMPAIADGGQQHSSTRSNGCKSSSTAESCSTEPPDNLTEAKISSNLPRLPRAFNVAILSYAGCMRPAFPHLFPTHRPS